MGDARLAPTHPALGLVGAWNDTRVPLCASFADGEAYAEVEFSTSLRANAPQDTPEPPIFRVSRRVFGDYTADGGVPVSELQVLVERTVDGVRETSVALAITEDGAVSVPGDLAVGDAGLTVNRLAERLNEVVEALRLVNITAHDAHAKAHDLAHDGSSPAKAARTCRSLLTSGATLSGEYWVKPCDVADPFLAFCDMTRDGGGWTRVLSYHQTQTPIARFADWPDASSVSDVAATRAFKGCLDAFDGGEIREEATSGAATVWATNVATSQFEEVMLTFGYDDCDDRVLNSRLPNCASTYGGDETHTACTRYPTSTNALGQVCYIAPGNAPTCLRSLTRTATARPALQCPRLATRHSRRRPLLVRPWSRIHISRLVYLWW